MKQKVRSKRVKALILALIIIANVILLSLAAWGISELLKNQSSVPPFDADGDDPNPDGPENPDPPVTKDNPVIMAKNVETVAGKYFNPLIGVTATDANGKDLTDRLILSGSVNTSREGQYKLTYSVTDDFARTTTCERTVTVLKNENLGKVEPVYIYTADTPYNIAEGCEAFSNSENGNATASKATDGNLSSRWESQHGSSNKNDYYPVDFTVDLGAELPIEQVVIHWEAAYATDYTLWVSTNGNIYTSVDSVRGQSLPADQRVNTHELNSVTARYVRLRCEYRATGYGYSIYEFQVFGKQGTVIPAEQYPILFDAKAQGSPDWAVVDEQWLLADLGSVKEIDYMELSWRDWLSPASFDVELSSDGNTYTPTVRDGDGYFLVNNVRHSVSARYVRINMHSRRFYMNAYRINQLLFKYGGAQIEGVTVTASSSQSGHPAENAVRLDNYSTWWESAHSVTPQTIDLGAVKQVGRVDLIWKGDDGRKGKYYDLQVSCDGEHFTTVFRQTHGGLEVQSVYVFENARYIRIVDMQSATDARFMLEGMVVHSQYPNESKIDYDVTVRFPEYETVETENGSYVTGGTDFPTAKLVTFLDESLRGKPIPSNDWWQSLLINDKGHNMFLNPLVARFDVGGLWLTNPGDGYYSGTIPGNGSQTINVNARDLRVGYAGLKTDATVRVVGYDDYSITAVMSDVNEVDKLTVFLAQGALYGYFVYAEPERATIYSNNLVAVYDAQGKPILTDGKVYTGDCIVVCVRTHSGYENNLQSSNKMTYEERYYVVNAPSNTKFTLFEGTINAEMSEGNYLSVGAMSSVNDFNPDEAALMHKHGYAFVLGTRCQFRFDGATNLVETEYRLRTLSMRDGYTAQAYSAFMPHHYKKSSDNLAGNYAYATVRGDSRAFAGNVYTTTDRFYGIVPQFVEPNDDGYSATYLMNQLLVLYNNVGGDKKHEESNLISGDPYWQGKNIHPMAMAALAADQIGAYDLRDAFLNKIRYILTDWFTYTPGNEPNDAYFYYDSEWGTLYYKNSEFGAGVNLADHHFTYGYYTFAAGVLSAFQPDFAELYGDMIELLIRDYMNWERNDDDFPFMRNYDVYAGHGWAGGYADNDGGNNQESAGEALNSWVGAYLYATAVGNDVIRETAICGFTTELNAIKQYWFNYDGDSFGDFYPYGTLGQLYGGSNFFGTFFNGEPLSMYGIHLIPGEEFLTSYALGDDEQAKLEKLIDKLREEQANWSFSEGQEELRKIHGWQHIFIPIVACYNAPEAIQWYEDMMSTQGNVGNDNEQFNVYYIIHALNSIGSRTTDIWATNGASATVYEKNGVYTALCWNPTSRDVKVVFRNAQGTVGYAIVPAHTLASCDPTKETTHIDCYEDANDFSLYSVSDSKNVNVGREQLEFSANGSVSYLLTFGRVEVYRRVRITASADVTLLVDGIQVPLVKTEYGYESQPLTLTLKHTVTVNASNATVTGLEFERLSLERINVKMTATASSYENDGTKAPNAVDGDYNSRWGSQHNDDEWLKLELSHAVTIYQLKIYWEAASAKEYEVYFSETGEEGDWTKVFDGEFAGGARTDAINPTVMTAKYILIKGISRTTVYGYSIYEVELYGLSSSDGQVGE